MEDKKVVKIPIDYKQRKINEYGQGYVPFEVSNRWLQFDDESALCQGGEFIGVKVMTLGSDEQPKKICQLIINSSKQKLPVFVTISGVVVKPERLSLLKN